MAASALAMSPSLARPRGEEEGKSNKAYHPKGFEPKGFEPKGFETFGIRAKTGVGYSKLK